MLGSRVRGPLDAHSVVQCDTHLRGVGCVSIPAWPSLPSLLLPLRIAQCQHIDKIVRCVDEPAAA